MRSARPAVLILIPRPAAAVSVPLGGKRFEWRAHASGWKWARVAVWDVAGNGAFVNPFWRP